MAATAANQQYYELYRGTSYVAPPERTYDYILIYRCYSVGMALADTLDALISSRRIEPQLAMRIMQNFDQSIAAVLSEKVKARMNFKGHLHTYRFCDEVWTFIVSNVHFKMENQHQFDAERIKIVACQAKEKAPG